MCRSVGGIQLAAQRCFCRQRSYQRDHARSRPIAEAKPVWARSVLPWVTRWESRVMLLSFSSSTTLSLSFLFSLLFVSFLTSPHWLLYKQPNNTHRTSSPPFLSPFLPCQFALDWPGAHTPSSPTQTQHRMQRRRRKGKEGRCTRKCHGQHAVCHCLMPADASHRNNEHQQRCLCCMFWTHTHCVCVVQ